MSSKDKRYKYVEELIEDYMRLTDEQIEIPLLLAKADEKHISLQSDWNGTVIKKGEVEDAYKVFLQIRKLEERRAAIQTEYAEVELLFRQFLTFLNDHQLSYEKKDDTEKTKITYLFWLEGGQIKCNR